MQYTWWGSATNLCIYANDSTTAEERIPQLLLFTEHLHKAWNFDPIVLINSSENGNFWEWVGEQGWLGAELQTRPLSSLVRGNITGAFSQPDTKVPMSFCLRFAKKSRYSNSFSTITSLLSTVPESTTGAFLQPCRFPTKKLLRVFSYHVLHRTYRLSNGLPPQK